MRTIVYIDGLNLYDTLPAVQIVLGQLLMHADFVKKVRRGVLEASQFPDPVLDSKGSIHKPSRW